MNQIKPILKKLKTYSSMSFSDYRKQQEKNHHNLKKNNDLFDSILTIELNLTELCNRKCVFCPRINPKVYPNRNLMMDIKLCKKLSKELKDDKIITDGGRVISITSFGKDIDEAVQKSLFNAEKTKFEGKYFRKDIGFDL